MVSIYANPTAIVTSHDVNTTFIRRRVSVCGVAPSTGGHLPCTRLRLMAVVASGEPSANAIQMGNRRWVISPMS